ncbi:MAG: amidohydrolase family protein, partial [Bilophila sp.]
TTLVEHPGFGASDCDLMQQIDTYTAEAAGRCAVDYAFHGVLQRVDAGILAQIPELVRQGIPTFKAYTTYDGRLNDEELLCALSAVEEAGGLLTVHAENHAMIRFLTAQLDATPARSDTTSYPKSRPAFCEAEAVYRVLRLAQTAQASVYIVHLSTAEGLQHIRRAQQGTSRKVIAETCPHYLLLQEDCYAEPDGRKYLMAPPLRTNNDREALWDGLEDGSIAVVATDHCSFSLAQKQAPDSVFHVPYGVAGVETRLPLLFSEGVLKGRLTLPRFVAVVATAPARIMGLPDKGHLSPGADADITVLDPADERLIKAS